VNQCAERCNCREGDPGIATPGYARTRRHDNAGDLDAIRRVLAWLREGRHVCHVRFADGEFYNVMGVGNDYGGHPYVRECGDQIRATLLDVARGGLPPDRRLLVGGEWEYDPGVWRWIEDHDLQDRVPWCPSQIFVQGVWDGTTLEVLKHVRQLPGPKYLVANPKVCHAVCGPLGAVPVEVRRRGSYWDMPRVRKVLDAGLPEGGIVLWCAGVGGKPVMWEMFKKYGSSHLDFGHFFDWAAGEQSRSWLACDNPRRRRFLETVVPWLERGGRP
jgi:hypothetical protein